MLGPSSPSGKRKRVTPPRSLSNSQQKRLKTNNVKRRFPPLPRSSRKKLEQYYGLTQNLKSTFRHINLSLRKATRLPNEIIEQVLIKTIPSQFDASSINFIMTTPIDKIAEFFTSSNIPRVELEAIKVMRLCAAIALVGPKKGDKYFKFQYGTTRFEQFINLTKAFGKFPSEILDDPDIEETFIDLVFINAYHLILNAKKSSLNLTKLHRLPSNIKILKHLKELHLFNECQLTSLPPAIRALENLEILNLDGNRFKTIPPEICTLRNLKNLSIAKNKLTTVPDDLDTLTSLTELDLSRNFFSDETKADLRRRFAHLDKNLYL